MIKLTKNQLIFFIFILGSLMMLNSLEANNIYNYSFEDGVNNKLNLADYKGKVVMVVNTASKCGFTGQYDDLEKLYNKYKDKGFAIIAVPSNDFANQEPGTNEEIQSFCKKNYGVTFPVVDKVHVKGDLAHPFYKNAREKLGFLASPKWNFHKYLIDKNGEIVEYYYSTTSPLNKKVTNKIEELLSAK